MRGYIEPDFGEIGTVTNIYIAKAGELTLELSEFPAPGGILGGLLYEPGWVASGFRPLVQTDISVFTAMLEPKRQKAKV